MQCSKERLFDHLVGTGEHHRGNVEIKRARRLRIEHKFELGRLQDRKVRWFGALEDAAGIDADLAERVHKIGPIAHQQAGFDHLARNITRWYSISHRQRRNLHTAAGEESIARDEKSIGSFTPKCSKRRVNLTRRAGIEERSI